MDNKDHESEEEGEVDPRVKGELDKLNQSTDDINRYENSLSEERAKFKQLLNEATTQLSELGKKREKLIKKARPYYDANKEINQASIALQKAVHNFQRANGVYRAAKETIQLAEERLKEFASNDVDPAWKEMINLQTQRFNEAESDRNKSEQIHQQAARQFEILERKVKSLKSKHKKSIEKTKFYFESKDMLETMLQDQSSCVDAVKKQVEEAKGRYSAALRNLEKISSEIHLQRKLDSHLRDLLAEREETIEGAEDDSTSLHEMNTDFDLRQTKTYDDINELQKDLAKFEEEKKHEKDDDVLSCSDEEDDEHFSSSSRNSSARSSVRNEDCSPEQNSGDSQTLPSPRKKKLSLPDNLAMLSVAKDEDYDQLHGIHQDHQHSAESSGKPYEEENFDIFDDLC